MKVIVPVGLKPPERAAESVRVGVGPPKVTEVGLGVVSSDGLAGDTVACSLGEPLSVVALLFASPE